MGHRTVLIALTLNVGLAALDADTVIQTDAQGRRQVIQRDAIVLRDDSYFLVYKHFDLKERRITKVALNQGSLPYSAETGNEAERQRIVAVWKRFGFTATVTDQSGKSTRLYDVYLDFYPPGGRGSLLESIPARTSLPMLFDDGGAGELDFAEIARLDVQGDHLKVTSTEGTVKEGRLLISAHQAVEARLLGITDHYDPASPEVFDFSIPLARVKQVAFEH